MPRPLRRPPPPRPQTARCRFADGAKRCRSIATVDGFCVPHRQALEQGMAKPSALDDLVSGLFGVRRVSTRRMAEAGVEIVSDQLRRRFPGLEPPTTGGQPGQPLPRGAGGARVSPEAIARRKAILSARGILGFEPDEQLTEAMVRDRRRDLVRVWHTDVAGQKDPTREHMLRKINAAAELLIEQARKPPRP